MNQLNDIIAVQALEPYRLRLRFENGIEGEVDLQKHFDLDGVFAPLHDPAFFAQAFVNADLGTVCWPNGADLDPVVLYRLVTG